MDTSQNWNRRDPSRRALVVEDDPSVRSLLTESLELEGFWVDAEPSVEQGRAWLSSYVYEVVVLDLKLPDGSGMDLVPEARAQSPNAQVVIMTGFSEEVLRRRATALGANTFLAKPFTAEELITAITPRQQAFG